MKYYRSIPTREQEREFFSDYAKFASSLTWLILVCQVISGLTESVIFFSIGSDTFHSFDTITANIMGILLAVFGVFMIEVFGLRFMLPQATRQFLYKRFKGMHLAMTIFITVVTLVLVVASIWLSLDGGNHTVISQVNKIEDRKKIAIRNLHRQRIAEAASDFETDSTETYERYAILKRTKTEKYNAELGTAKAELNTWTRKKGNYSTRINKALTKIESIKAAKAKDISDLQSRESLEQKARRNELKATKDSLQTVFTTELDRNTKNYDNTESTFSWATWIAVLVAIFLSIVCIIIKSIYLKGSGQKDIPLPNDYNFRQNSVVEAWEVCSERIQTQIRNSIVDFEGKTPQPKISKRIAPVYDRTNLRELVIKLELEQVDDSARTIQLSVPSISKTVRPIGFKTNETTIKSQKRNATVTDSNSERLVQGDTNIKTDVRTCDECEIDIRHKRSDARFCSTPCRKKWHSKRHGGNEYDEYYKIK